MRPSVRFLVLAVIGWAGVRAASLGMLPVAGLFTIERTEARTPAIAATQFPPIEPVATAVPPPAPYPPADYGQYAQYAYYPQQPARPMLVPVYYPAPISSPVPSRSPHLDALMPTPRGSLYGAPPALDEMPMSRLAAISVPASISTPVQVTPDAPQLRPKFDRLQLSSWALLRNQQTGVAGSRSLASGGQLGASQAGARLIYNFNRQLALAARFSSEVGRRGGEFAAGIRIHPLVHVPVWVTAERRQRMGRFGGGRNDFAIFAEAGVYQQSLPWRLRLDSYLQGGVVGVKSRDLFIDGSLAITRPVYRNFSFGFGVWGGAQPGLSRVDAGPRVTMQVRRNVKVHADWRQKLAGNARPGSGPALTLAGDF